VELYVHSANMLSWCGAQLKHRDSFTITFTLPEGHVSFIVSTSIAFHCLGIFLFSERA
jgi:hypothetical protein